ncbi:MAG: hypothetical protein RJB39_240 [Candidatus Parcubacteria bacterium]
MQDYQQYIREMVVERGFDKESLPEIFMLFTEECGELAKAIRKSASGLKTDNNSEIFKLEQEAADVFIYLLDICNHLNIDLEKAFRDKEEINKQRTWA